MSRYEPGQLVRFRTTDDTVRDGVDGELGVVVKIDDAGRPEVSVWGFTLAAYDDELVLET